MDRRNYYNILDFGSSKIRFTVFDDKLNKAYTDTKPVILEDNFINQQVATTMIEKYGCRVTPAGNGKDKRGFNKRTRNLKNSGCGF